MASSKSTKVSTGVQSTAGGDQEPKEEKLALDDAVVNYLNIKDGESGSQQDLDDAVNAMVAALPEDKTPASLAQEEQPKSE